MKWMGDFFMIIQQGFPDNVSRVYIYCYKWENDLYCRSYFGSFSVYWLVIIMSSFFLLTDSYTLRIEKANTYVTIGQDGT